MNETTETTEISTNYSSQNKNKLKLIRIITLGMTVLIILVIAFSFIFLKNINKEDSEINSYTDSENPENFSAVIESNTICVEQWSCESSQCTKGKITRKCIDENNCGTFEFRPLLEVSC